MIKTIVLGDRSRYQVFERLINGMDQRKLEETKRSWLWKHTLLVTNSPKQREDAEGEEIDLTVSSHCIPLYTELLFPAEAKPCSGYGQESNLVVFDEFPYCTETELERIEKLKAKNPFGNIRIVLFDEKRKTLDTDTTNMQTAREEAKKTYSDLGIETIEYSQTGLRSLFFWFTDDLMKCSLRKGKTKLDELNERLKDFALNYDVFYLCELEEEVEDISLLQQFVEFGRDVTKEKTIIDIFRDRAETYFFEKRYEAVIKEKLLTELYANELIQDAAYLWDRAQDEKLLVEEMRSRFHNFFKDLRNYEFDGKEERYENFLNETHVAIEFKQKCIDFFKTGILEIISDHVKRRIQLIGRFVHEV